MLYCAACNVTYPEGKKFCRVCGAALVERPQAAPTEPLGSLCPHCSAPIRPGARFCKSCGQSLAAGEAAAPPPQAAAPPVAHAVPPEPAPPARPEPPRRVPPQAQPRTPARAPFTPAIESETDWRRYALIGGVALLVLGALTGGLYLWQRQPQTSPTSEQQSAAVENRGIPAASPQPPPAQATPADNSQPVRPSLLSPGSSTAPGTTITTTTPTLEWSPVPGATGYGLYVSAAPFGPRNLVYENEAVPADATSLILPPGVLAAGAQYRWNLRARTSVGWGEFSDRLYFQVNTGSQQ